MRAPLLLCLLAASLPLAWAHEPAGTPDPACEDGSLHDYVPTDYQGFGGGVRALPPQRPILDGSLGDPGCPGGDGHAEFGLGAAYLAVESGDGTTSGSLACLGTPSHHTASIRVLDAAGHGPSFLVASDRSHWPPASGPDCGDGVIRPCPDPTVDPLPPPLGGIIDTVNQAIESVFRELEPVYGPWDCTPGDHLAETWWSSSAGPNAMDVAFPPGADGSYVVFPRPLSESPPATGHVWTV